jgi:hypothetical protein
MIREGRVVVGANVRDRSQFGGRGRSEVVVVAEVLNGLHPCSVVWVTVANVMVEAEVLNGWHPCSVVEEKPEMTLLVSNLV